ncbi:MAG: HAMP domain-containing sensor histidine kinase [Bacillota bacterium]
MISFNQFFKHKMTRFFSILFAGLLLASNIGLYIFSSIQYNNQIARQEEAFLEIMSHFILMEDLETSIIYVEHYEHTQGINIIYYDPQGIILYQSPIPPENDRLLSIVDNEGNMIGQVIFDDQTSVLGIELSWGLFWVNVLSIGVFFIGFLILYKYLNKQYQILAQDFDRIGQDVKFRFSDIESINQRYLEAVKLETDMKKLQAHYVQTLAHDVKTPLTVMKTYLDGLKNKRLSFNDQINQDLIAEIQSIESLIPKLIASDMTHIEQNQNIALLLRAIITKLEPIFQTKQIRIISQIDDMEMNIATVDIQRLVEHLLFNAYYYSQSKNSIEIILDAQKKTLKVTDHGLGMNEETLMMIKQGPYRDKTSIKYHQKGSGIGLQIVFDIIKRIDAQYEIQSIIGQGTSFIVFFK